MRELTPSDSEEFLFGKHKLKAAHEYFAKGIHMPLKYLLINARKRVEITKFITYATLLTLLIQQIFDSFYLNIHPV